MENSQQVTIEELRTGLVVTVHRSRLTKTTMEELLEQERRTILLRPGEARRIRDHANQETYYPSRSGGSESEISSDSSSSDEPWGRADNEDQLLEPDEFWEEPPRMGDWQGAMPAEPTTRFRDDRMPTTRTPEEAVLMDTSPTKKRTGTVPAKLSNINS